MHMSVCFCRIECWYMYWLMNMQRGRSKYLFDTCHQHIQCVSSRIWLCSSLQSRRQGSRRPRQYSSASSDDTVSSLAVTTCEPRASGPGLLLRKYIRIDTEEEGGGRGMVREMVRGMVRCMVRCMVRGMVSRMLK